VPRLRVVLPLWLRLRLLLLMMMLLLMWRLLILTWLLLMLMWRLRLVPQLRFVQHRPLACVIRRFSQ
jgi:hypothetical protein